MINIHKYYFVENEYLYGPGKRLLLFCQGCSLHCQGCVNQHLWEFGKGQDISSDEIFNLCSDIDGITLHGGEPLDQSEELLPLVYQLKKINKTVILFTGYSYKELKLASQKKIWRLSDIVVAGRYVASKRNIYLQFRGSSNQRIYTHKGKYENYKVNDGKSVTLLSLNKNGQLNVKGFKSNNLQDILNIFTKK